MDEELQRRILAALERPHRLGMIGGDLADHVAHATYYAELFAPALGLSDSTSSVRAADLGTGGGIPGVVLAALRPDWHWTLIDVRSARADEVRAAVARLGLEDCCEVLAEAAQELGRGAPLRATFDLAVARAFGPPSVLAECAAGLLRVGGALIVSEPPESHEAEGDDGRWPPAPLEVLGFAEVEQAVVAETRFAVLRKVAETPERFPRTPPRNDRGWPKPH